MNPETFKLLAAAVGITAGSITIARNVYEAYN